MRGIQDPADAYLDRERYEQMRWRQMERDLRMEEANEDDFTDRREFEE